jgi:plastocyanin
LNAARLLRGGVLVVLALLPGRSEAQAVARGRRLTVTAAGFEPATVRARAGELIRLAVVAGDREHCFSLPAGAIEKRLQPGRSVVVEVTFERPGSYAFTCCVEARGAAESGAIIVE